MMIRLLCLGVLCSYCTFADEVVWKGKVNSDGTPTPLITLNIHDTYQIKARQFINLGKWVQARDKLANDACYEFGEKIPPSKVESLKNSNNISVCDGNYHADHVYESKPFEAKHNRLFFWVLDSDYDDNSGAFEVEVIRKIK